MSGRTEIETNMDPANAVFLLAMLVQKYGHDNSAVFSAKAVYAMPEKIVINSVYNSDTGLVTITVKEVTV